MKNYRYLLIALLVWLSIPALGTDKKITPISCMDLVLSIARTGNIHGSIDRLEAKYGATNFQMPIPLSGGRRLFIFQDTDEVKRTLRASTLLPYVNRNFDLSHGHFNSINSVNTTDPLWVDLHQHLIQIFKNKKITSLMLKYRDILTARDSYNLNDALEEFFLKVWGEYCFGPTDPAEFKRIRDLLVDTLGDAFHKNPLNRLPFIGRWTSQLNFQRNKAKFAEVDAGLTKILQNAIAQKQGAFYELYERLQPTYPNAFQITLDNAFLGVLVYDFLYIVLLDAMVNIAQHPERDRESQIQTSTHQGFLYPFRFRIAAEDFGEVKRGDYIVINLQKSGLHFSYGARFCPGMNLFRESAATLLSLFKRYDIAVTDPSQAIVYNGSRDVPIMVSRHDVTVTPRFQGRNLILLGSASSGKGTLAEGLNREYGLPIIAGGAIVQDEIDRKTPFGLKVEEMKRQGILLPDDEAHMGYVLKLVKERIAQAKNGFILDGIPRTAWQAAQLKGIFKELGIELDALIEIDVSRDVLRQRALGRLVCVPCQMSYHRTLRPPVEEGHCDHCGGTLRTRPEDSEGVLERRWNDYDAAKHGILAHFANVTVTVDGNQESASVFEAAVNGVAQVRQGQRFDRTFLERRIQSFPHESIPSLRIYNLVEMYKEPGLLQYIVDKFAASITDLNPDYIAAPEARALPIFGALSYATGKPGIMIRKAGKLPRSAPLLSETYSTAYSNDTIEMTDDPALLGKTVVIVDDGLASAGTTLATIRLLQKAGMKVVGVRAVVEHHYRKRLPEYGPWEDKTLTLFDLSKPIPLGNIEIFETEKKFLVPRLSALPESVLNPLQTGANDPLILRRGYVLQEYLPLPRLEEVIQLLNEAQIPFGTPDQQAEFLQGRTQAKEVRLMSKSIRVRQADNTESVEELFQITIKGPGGLSVKQLETPERLSPEQYERIRNLVSHWSPSAEERVRKAYFEPVVLDPNGKPRLRPDGTPYTAEIDVYLAGTRAEPSPLFINGEIEFHGADQQASVAQASGFGLDASTFPTYFGADLTEEAGVKARHIAQQGVPEPWRMALSAEERENARILGRVLDDFDRWSNPEVRERIWGSVGTP
jgi:adenylate kinase